MILQAQGSPLTLDVDERRATLAHSGEPVRSWQVMSIDSLSTRLATDLASDRDTLLFIDRAAPKALATLRESGVSYVTRAGEWHLVAPPDLLVVKPADRKPPVDPSPDRPLGKGAARIARRLLLRSEDEPTTITDLAHESQVSEATGSRSIRHLAERDLVVVTTADDDARRRYVTVRDRASLLDALADESPWRHARRTTWDVGAHSVDEALSLIRRAGSGLAQYAVGELAGAALIRRLVEPAIVVLWIPDRKVAAWRDELIAQPARPAPGRIAVRIAPDPVVLDWGPEIDGLRIADPVQLYIDCRHAGERAIDTADTLRREILDR